MRPQTTTEEPDTGATVEPDVGLVGVLDRGAQLDAGVVDQHVEGTMVGLGLRHRLRDLRGIAHVEREDGDGQPLRTHRARQLLVAPGIAHGRHHAMVAVGEG